MKKFKFKLTRTVSALVSALLVVSYFSACSEKEEPLPELSSEKEMTGFNIFAGGQTFSAELQSDGKSFHFMAPFGFNNESLKTATATFTISKGAISVPASGESMDFTKDVKYVVKAQDQTTITYTVHKIDGTSSNAEFRTFSLRMGVGPNAPVATGLIDEPNSTVWIQRSEVEELAMLENATPTFTLSLGATATPLSGVKQDFREAVEYRITANDGTQRDWTVKLSNRSDAEVVHFYLDIYENAQSTYAWRGDIQMSDPDEVTIDRETRTITYNLPPLPSWFTPAKLTVFPAVIEISVGATVSPDWNVPQDFTKDVVYTVTAEDGVTTKVWTVKAPKYYMKEKWNVDYASLRGIVTDILSETPNSIALIGDYVSIGRTPDLLNKSDGSLSGVKLNVTGWRELNNQGANTDPALITQDFPFFIANDDAGNLIASNLGAWNTDNFTITKWTSPSAEPVKLMEFSTKNSADAQFASFGRKVQALGDINGKGLIIASNFLNENSQSAGEHYVWKINNGVVDVDNPIVTQTTIPMMNYGYQLITPLGTEFEPPYYIGSSTVRLPDESYAYVNLQFGDIGNVTEIKGPFGAVCLVNAANGWGNFHWLYHKLFSFDNKNMIATFSASNGTYYYYCFAVLERNADNSHVPVATAAIPWSSTDWPNGNGSGTFTMEKVGNDVFFYVFPTNRAIVCYQLSKF